ncbi:hypothetical protein F5Y19DRAFT_487620 [Xylariaceae sp. FL1651]|nr:hypothetical protein F5Y19DRAFT_487620 [Xylariaceae sp. FL1651]
MALPTEYKVMSDLQPDHGAHYLHVYRDFAVKYLKLTSDLDILLFVGNNQGTSLPNTQLASWPPSWNHEDNVNSRLFIPGRKAGTSVFSLNGSSLQVQAVLFGPVHPISDQLKPVEEEPYALTQVLGLWSQLQISHRRTGSNMSHPHQGRLDIAFLQIINCRMYEGDLEEWVQTLKKFGQSLQEINCSS